MGSVNLWLWKPSGVGGSGRRGEMITGGGKGGERSGVGLQEDGLLVLEMRGGGDSTGGLGDRGGGVGKVADGECKRCLN